MAADLIIPHIRRIPLFGRLPPDHLSLVAGVAEIFDMHPNQVVYRKDQPLPGLYLLLNGRAFLMGVDAQGQRQQMGVIEPGQYVGDQALLGEKNAELSLRIIEAGQMVFISRRRFNDLMAEYPEIRVNLNIDTTAFPDTRRPIFNGQRPGEKVLIMRRRHPWAIVRSSWLPVLIGLALLLIATLLPPMLLTPFILGLAVIIPGAWIIYVYTEWTDDVIIVTDQRVLRVENMLLAFRSHTSETPLASVQAVNFLIPSGDPMAHLLRYGTIKINTAGQSGNIDMDILPRPEEVQRVLFANQERLRHDHKRRNRETIAAEIDKFLGPDEESAGENTRPAAPPPPDDPMVPAPNQRPGLLATRFVNARGETVYRKHVSVWLAHVILPAIVILVSLGIIILGLLSVGALQSVAGVQMILGFFGLLVGVIWFYWADWDWRNDLYIVGSQSITLIHRRPLWLQNINDQVLLRQVDNVLSRKSGLVDTLLNRGDVEISLVGDNKPAKVFVHVPTPDQIQEEISAKRNQAAAQAEREEAQRQHQMISEYLDVYHERIRDRGGAPGAPPPPPPANAAQTESPEPRRPRRGSAPLPRRDDPF